MNTVSTSKPSTPVKKPDTPINIPDGDEQVPNYFQKKKRMKNIKKVVKNVLVSTLIGVGVATPTSFVSGELDEVKDAEKTAYEMKKAELDQGVQFTENLESGIAAIDEKAKNMMPENAVDGLPESELYAVNEEVVAKEDKRLGSDVVVTAGGDDPFAEIDFTSLQDERGVHKDSVNREIELLREENIAVTKQLEESTAKRKATELENVRLLGVKKAYQDSIKMLEKVAVAE